MICLTTPKIEWNIRPSIWPNKSSTFLEPNFTPKDWPDNRSVGYNGVELWATSGSCWTNM